MKLLTLIYLLFFHYAFASAAEQVTVPIKVVDTLPTLELKLNGKPYAFMLDTGSLTSIHLRESVAANIAGLTYTGEKQKSIDLAGKLKEDAKFVIPELDVNGLRVKKLSGVIYSPWGLTIGNERNEMPEESVLGVGFFSDKQVLIDLAHKTLSFATETAPSLIDGKDGWINLPFEMWTEGIVLTTNDGKYSYNMVLDSGATVSFIKSNIARQNGDIKKCTAAMNGGDACQALTIPLPNNRSVSAMLQDIPAAFEADGLLGMDFFQQYAVYIDIKHKKFAIKATR
jgi:hypothetical protein